MNAFKVGDVVIGQHFQLEVHRNGMEGVIFKGTSICDTIDSMGVRIKDNLVLGVHWSDGSKSWCSPRRLRKKQPPKRDIDTVVKWEDCDWQPSRVPT